MINWSITSLESNPLTGIVISAGWKCSNEQVNRTGISVFNEPIETIIPYANLTEDIVLNWVWTNGGVEKTLVDTVPAFT